MNNKKNFCMVYGKLLFFYSIIWFTIAFHHKKLTSAKLSKTEIGLNKPKFLPSKTCQKSRNYFQMFSRYGIPFWPFLEKVEWKKLIKSSFIRNPSKPKSWDTNHDNGFGPANNTLKAFQSCVSTKNQ